MKSYPFGYLFVRLAKILAVVLFAAGLLAATLRYVQGALDARARQYAQSKALEAELSHLDREYERLQTIMARSLHRTVAPLEVRTVATAPRKTAEFAALGKRLTEISKTRDEIKDSLIATFESAIESIEQKLQAHAAELRGEEAKKDAPPAGSPDEKKSLNTPETVFLDLGGSELGKRIDALGRSREFISKLKNSVEKPENAALLITALQELDELGRLLPSSLEIAPAAAAEPKPDEEKPPGPPTQLAAERVANQLRQVRALVRASVLTDWSIDQTLARVAESSEAERQRCAESEQALQRLWLETWIWVSAILLGATLTAFLVLVTADLVRSFLDSAAHSAKIAAAFEGAKIARE
ncbi:MAG TPA: hypothetical protein VGO11_14180 [Chthoniobacteraceae bacterium]|jgi:hypothetical protein|nr:hypothetical protein [Chthoniobacteraceae bacterium]